MGRRLAGEPFVQVAIELDDAMTFGADEMMVVVVAAEPVAGLARMMVELVDDAAFAERGERSVHGCKPDPAVALPKRLVDFLRRCVLPLLGEGGEHRQALARGAEALLCQKLGWALVHHACRIVHMRLRTILIMVAAASVALAVSGCGSSSNGSSGKERVVAAFYPIAFAAEQIGGSRVEVRNLTPAGAEPHDLEVTPSNLEAFRSADLVLLLGHGFQPQIERAAGSGERVVLLLDTPGLNRFANNDPHVWLDPLRYALIVRRIGNALHASEAAARLLARLQALDREYRRGLAHCARHEIVTSHEAFAYLGQRYGLRQIAVEGLSPEAEPTPQKLASAIALVRKTHATTVFFETLVSPRIAETVARDTGRKTAVLDPIEGLTPAAQDRGEDYFSVMRSNLAALRQALGCR